MCTGYQIVSNAYVFCEFRNFGIKSCSTTNHQCGITYFWLLQVILYTVKTKLNDLSSGKFLLLQVIFMNLQKLHDNPYFH